MFVHSLTRFVKRVKEQLEREREREGKDESRKESNFFIYREIYYLRKNKILLNDILIGY